MKTTKFPAMMHRLTVDVCLSSVEFGPVLDLFHGCPTSAMYTRHNDGRTAFVFDSCTPMDVSNILCRFYDYFHALDEGFDVRPLCVTVQPTHPATQITEQPE